MPGFCGYFRFRSLFKLTELLRNWINNYNLVFSMLRLLVSILLSLQTFLYCWFIFHRKHILIHVTTGMPPKKAGGFSWYAVRATLPERVKCHKIESQRNIKNKFDFGVVLWATHIHHYFYKVITWNYRRCKIYNQDKISSSKKWENI